jgi:hypothetical protein
VLPDSATNPAGSQGFVDFTVYPKPDLPLGTLVPNRAAIYFDHNPPVITNTVERTYAKVISVSVNDPKDKEQLLVKVFPNPFVTETTFALPENAPKGAYQLELLDPAGRLLRTLAFNGLECRLSKGDLPAGVLAWAITSEGRIVASGKVMAQ